jgi:hypothetical protein
MFNGGSMNKIFILLSFLIVSSMVFISCFQDDCMNATGYNNCIVLDDCNNNSDCSENQFCSLYDGKCHENPCVHENITCGLGECVINETGGYSCECNEDGGKIDNTRRCLLKCNSYKDCVDFKPDGDRVYPVCSDTINGGVCNLATCHGDDSCPDGKVCNEERNLCE